MEIIIVLSNKEVKGMDTLTHKITQDGKHNDLAHVAFGLYARLSTGVEFANPFRFAYTTKYMKSESIAGAVAKIEAEDPQALVFSTVSQDATVIGVRSTECSAGLRDGREYAVCATHYMFRDGSAEWSEILFSHAPQKGRTLCEDLDLKLAAAHYIRKVQPNWTLEYIYSSDKKLVDERKHMRFLVNDSTGSCVAEGFPLLGIFTISDMSATKYEVNDLVEMAPPSLGGLLYSAVLPGGREPNAKEFMAQINEIHLMARARMQTDRTCCTGSIKQSAS